MHLDSKREFLIAHQNEFQLDFVEDGLGEEFYFSHSYEAEVKEFKFQNMIYN